ncbi:DUF2768 domain-containing protein [Priestia taiwanensis]|uniref:DUF2768 domain-containing protein n=1 Tax=Priestia taiwanensis TaxID=1347902 RepID=A0A917AKN0_9BACI|nr:DUF2768 domain-containing protein [Priestia taiwanensis]MBM7361687.1 hypothetical protein [Priestia taiwanensis]GGE56196.1 hypothetical protein GCM10007140_03120 [Priestia taiwanensis]
MSEGLMKMWLSLGGIAGLFISVVLILFSRHKLKNKVLRFTTAFVAYAVMIYSSFVVFLVLFS